MDPSKDHRLDICLLALMYFNVASPVLGDQDELVVRTILDMPVRHREIELRAVGTGFGFYSGMG